MDDERVAPRRPARSDDGITRAAPHLTPRVIARFWDKAAPEPNTGCLLWEAGVSKCGYGKFQVTNTGGEGPKQLHLRAHRLAYFLANGHIDRRLVLHSCDTPSCINPDHLRLGTQSENIREMHAKGRAANQITPADVEVARRLYAEGVPSGEIAWRINRPASVVRQAVGGHAWAWVEAS